jgi:hypothetical protein
MVFVYVIDLRLWFFELRLLWSPSAFENFNSRIFGFFKTQPSCVYNGFFYQNIKFSWWCFEEFKEQFPIVAIVYEKFRQTLHLCLNNFRESGTIGRKEGSGHQVKRLTQEVIGNVQQIMEDSPRTSIRHLSQQLDLSVGTCHKILKEDLHLLPYRLTSVQESCE